LPRTVQVEARVQTGPAQETSVLSQVSLSATTPSSEATHCRLYLAASSDLLSNLTR
jgi:hypothetical protein